MEKIKKNKFFIKALIIIPFLILFYFVIKNAIKNDSLDIVIIAAVSGFTFSYIRRILKK